MAQRCTIAGFTLAALAAFRGGRESGAGCLYAVTSNRSDDAAVWATADDIAWYAWATDDQCPGSGSTLFEVGRDGSDVVLERVGCVELSDGSVFQPAGGVSIESVGGRYLYMAKTTTLVHVFEVVTVGESVELQHVASVDDPRLRAQMQLGKGMSYDPVRDLLATAYPSRGLTLWDVSDPTAPQALWSDPGLDACRVAVGGNFMQVYGVTAADAWTYDISHLDDPVLVDAAFWDPSNSWNQICASGNNYDAVLHPTEDVMYLARFARDQIVELSACAGATGFADGFESGDAGAWSAAR